MKLPRRNFLHLAAGAAALPFASCFAWAQPIRRGWWGSSSPFLQAKPHTPSRGSWVNRCRSDSGSHSSLRTERVPATISAPKASCGQRLTVIRAPACWAVERDVRDTCWLAKSSPWPRLPGAPEDGSGSPARALRCVWAVLLPRRHLKADLCSRAKSRVSGGQQKILTGEHDLSVRRAFTGKHMPCRRSCATLPSQQNWLVSSFGACNEMPEVPARKHRYGEVLRGMCCSAAPNL